MDRLGEQQEAAASRVEQQGAAEKSVQVRDFIYDEVEDRVVVVVSEGGQKKEETHPFSDFLYSLREVGLPVSTAEWVDLQLLLSMGEVKSVDGLYYAARAVLVKKVDDYNKFNQVFGEMFLGMEVEPGVEEQLDHDETEQKESEGIKEVVEASSYSSEDVHGGNEVTKDIEGSPSRAEGGKRKRNESNKEASGEKKEEGKVGEKAELGDDKKQGGGTGEGVKYPGEELKSAREMIRGGDFGFLSPDRELGYENMARVLARLKREFRGTSAQKSRSLDVKASVTAIAKAGGLPELRWTEEVEEKPDVMVLFDVGGSTDRFRDLLEKLFAAAKDEFDNLDIYYFHNAIYGEVWSPKYGDYGKEGKYTPLKELLRKKPETKVIIVGDAWMAEYELWNDDSSYDGEKVDISALEHFRSIRSRFPNVVWLNPIRESEQKEWDDSGTIRAVREVFPMYDLTVAGLEAAVRKLMET